MPVSRITVIRAERLGGEEAANRWLGDVRDDSGALSKAVADALAVVNRALHAARAATLDPVGQELSAERALAVRVGHGTGDELAGGDWSEAIAVPAARERERRLDALRPQERLAAVLGGRDAVEVCETLLLRARADIGAGRAREAALELRSGVEALLASPSMRAAPDQASDLAELEARRDSVDAAARTALTGEPDATEVARALAIAERVLRRRRILGSSRQQPGKAQSEASAQ